MDPITEAEKSEFRELLAVIFGDQALQWNINIKVLELFGQLMQSSESCSRYMDLVPRPFVAGSVIQWAKKQARSAIIRHLKNGGEHYLICLRAAGLGRKTEFHMASQGL
ncbi:hypothetical protein [Microbulbifer halophilus]|uniref:Uncharacterized protein n=1 Tax=Microbulbifer halophilus TaxID=453963 RepID=A0ABW5EAD5_9GAMM|nr:hypothetical protein [Microbulbifer halophilus]MCW8127551.1 hypothetical protein [Microbulbifer halophilus]